MKTFRPKQMRPNQPNFRPNQNPNLPTQKNPVNFQRPTKPGNKGSFLKLISLGGSGEVTRNMYVYEYGPDIVIIDCGVGFPDEAMPGIDLVIPDITYLKDKKQKIRGILITHAHDDHIGGLPYIWPELDVPIYTQKLTAGLIRAKFIEHQLPKDKIKTVGLNESLKLGAFEASFYQVSHSIPDSTGIVLKTPVGTLIHQADFKMDWTPVNGQVTDVGKVAQIGTQGVTLMAIDCLRVEKQGYTLSEKTIEPTFEAIEKETTGKLLITMTSSNITRVQQAINVAVKSGRKIALVGRSVDGNFQVARDLGYLSVPPGLVIATDQAKRFADNKLLILIAGSQGQPGSALSRVANNDHKFVNLKKGDGVIFSADPIPSSESAQNALIDNLTKLGCNVYYSALTSDLHVSGHAAAEELKLMINLAKPKFLLPIGGTPRHMRAFAKMAVLMGYQENQVLMPTDGQVLEVTHNRVDLGQIMGIQNVYVDGLGVGDVGSIILRDRQVMSAEGVVVVVVSIDQHTSKVVGEPDIISRGFIFESAAEDLIDAGKEIVKSCIKETQSGLDWRYTKHNIEEHLEKFFYEETKRSPLILSVLVEV